VNGPQRLGMPMHMTAPSREFGVMRLQRTAPANWFELPAQDLPLWNNVLGNTKASIYQYPFWNEPYRRIHVRPRYLACGPEDSPLAFTSILSLGFGPAKIGLIFRGPVQLNPGIQLSQNSLAGLLNWARANGYVFLRFTHSDAEVLADIAAVGNAQYVDACPYLLDYPVTSEDYVVAQSDSAEETLASFDREARRKIRRGCEAGYEFQSTDSAVGLSHAWALHQDCSHRKHFRLERPLSFYVDLMRGAQFYNRVRHYTLSLNGKLVGSTLVFRDSTTAHCVLAAFDPAHRQSAALLHWHSMRDMYRLGAHDYNLGPGPGSLARFKRQFCKSSRAYPGALTIVLKEGWFRAWQKTLPIAKHIRPMLRKLAFGITD